MTNKNIVFEEKYSKYIEPLYGDTRNENDDNLLLEDNILPHSMSIPSVERINLTHLDTYTIDPEGCTDADDAFSISESGNKLNLAIHIADPTEFINMNSMLWKDIENRMVTKYPSNRKPLHMLPTKIIQQSSLMDNEYGNLKLAITVNSEIDKTTFLPIGEQKLYFSKVFVPKSNNFTYNEAANRIESLKELSYGIKISRALQKRRGLETIGIKLNELNNSILNYNDKEPFLYICSDEEREMKHMIAEFAIFANSFIGEYFKKHFDNNGIFRTCDASELNTIQSGHGTLTGEQLIHEIVLNGIQANYEHTASSHDLVGAQEYTHFTSPIRRASDCICHYLLKYIYIKHNENYTIDNPINEHAIVQMPFTIEKLKLLSERCLAITKQMKKIQYKDNKFRYIQAINLMLQSDFEVVNIEYYITSYKEPFLNLIINKINHHYVYISYTLKLNISQYLHQPRIVHHLPITFVNVPGKFDMGTIPELDTSIMRYFSCI